MSGCPEFLQSDRAQRLDFDGASADCSQNKLRA
jgi:hypothetical protein